MARPDSSSGKPAGKQAQKPEQPSAITWDERLVDMALARRREVGGALLFLFAVISLLVLAGVTQAGWLAWWPRLLRQIFGWGAYVVCLSLAAIGLYLIVGRLESRLRVQPAHIVGAGILIVAALGLSHLAGGFTLRDAFAGRGGGLVGWALSEPLFDFLGGFLAILVYAALFAWAFMLLTGRTWEHARAGLVSLSARLAAWADRIDPDRVDVVGHADLDTPRAITDVATRAGDLEIVVVDSGDEDSRGRRRDPRLPSIDLLNKSETLDHARDEIAWKSQPARPGRHPVRRRAGLRRPPRPRWRDEAAKGARRADRRAATRSDTGPGRVAPAHRGPRARPPGQAAPPAHRRHDGFGQIGVYQRLYHLPGLQQHARTT
jgi:S-DNA-T family DNA segregation ATPase FtsK/SpoIIIE